MCLQGGRLETCNNKKVKNWFGKNIKKYSANCDLRFHSFSKLKGPG